MDSVQAGVGTYASTFKYEVDQGRWHLEGGDRLQVRHIENGEHGHTNRSPEKSAVRVAQRKKKVARC